MWAKRPEATCRVPDVLLVTGGGGLLGRRLMGLLSSLPAPVTAVLRDSKKVLPEWKNAEIIEGDLCDFKTWQKIRPDITHVFHLAARLPSGKCSGIEADNIKPVRHLLKASKKWRNLKQVIYSSSISAGMRPLSPYAESKRKGEILLNTLKKKKIKVCSLRLSSIYDRGKNDGTVMPLMIDRAVNLKQITLFGKGSRTQDFVHAWDAAQALLQAYRCGKSGVFNIGSGKATSMKALAHAVNRIFAAGKAKIVYDRQKPDGAGVKINIAPARRSLKYTPKISLRKGLLMLKEGMSS